MNDRPAPSSPPPAGAPQTPAAHAAYDPAGADPPPGANPQRPSAELLLWAYRHGIFPMADPRRGGRIEWFNPETRGILPLSEGMKAAAHGGMKGSGEVPSRAASAPAGAFHIPKNLAREVRRARFEIRCDTSFEQVMRACDTDRSLWNQSWLSERLIEAYVDLHRRGHAHSIEAWTVPGNGVAAATAIGNGRAAASTESAGGDQPRVETRAPDANPPTHRYLDTSTPPPHTLVGGLYGVHVGGAFFGESMFARPDLGGSNASKICLVHLVNHLRARGFSLLDTQFWNPHLDQFGCEEISADEYLERLNAATSLPVTWGEFPR